MSVTAPEFDYEVAGAEAVPFAAAPTLALKLRITTAPDQQVHSILLRCQIQIETTRRRYQPDEQSKLSDLFGPPPDWDRTLRRLLWTSTSTSVPGFVGSTLVDLPVPCTYDVNLAFVKYFDALAQGDVPLCLLFSGTVFYAAQQGELRVGQIPWEKEASYRLRVEVWRELMRQYYPNTAWLYLRKDVFDRLQQYKRLHTLPTWEQTVENLLAAAQEPAPSAP